MYEAKYPEVDDVVMVQVKLSLMLYVDIVIRPWRSPIASVIEI
jgi:hypothetical protein